MKISVITLFPSVISTYLNTSIMKRAQKKGLIQVEVIDLREFGTGKHKSVDDTPYGGGAGMILRADVLADALKSITKKTSTINHKLYTIFTSPSGKTFNQQNAKDLSKLSHIVLICGHYEGVDQRFIDKYVDEEISVGDYVLTGGELPALTVIDATVRLLKGVLEKEEATRFESFENNLLEHPHYTRPENFEGEKVPEVLTSGNNQKIADWKKEKSLEKTTKIRRDLLDLN